MVKNDVVEEPPFPPVLGWTEKEERSMPPP